MNINKTFRLARPFLIILGVAAFSAAANAAESTASSSAVTFSQINQSIIQTSCVSCHSGAAAPHGVDLSSYDGIAAQVVAGSPQQSALYKEISDGTMPPTGALPQDQIQQLSDWITSGAQNN